MIVMTTMTVIIYMLPVLLIHNFHDFAHDCHQQTKNLQVNFNVLQIFHGQIFYLLRIDAPGGLTNRTIIDEVTP